MILPINLHTGEDTPIPKSILFQNDFFFFLREAEGAFPSMYTYMLG